MLNIGYFNDKILGLMQLKWIRLGQLHAVVIKHIKHD